jgi:hypothetical protein
MTIGGRLPEGSAPAYLGACASRVARIRARGVAVWDALHTYPLEHPAETKRRYERHRVVFEDGLA